MNSQNHVLFPSLDNTSIFFTMEIVMSKEEHDYLVNDSMLTKCY